MSQEPDHAVESFDYSTPETQEALAGVSALLLEIRDEYVRIQEAAVVAPPTGAPTHWERLVYERKIALYERTLGLAVIPVLVRRGVWVVVHRLRRHSGDAR